VPDVARQQIKLPAYEKYMRRKKALWAERASWDSHWREISEVLLPRAGRFDIWRKNKGDKRHGHIVDSTATKALRTLAAGLMAGMTSPERPWFRLTTPDPDLAESPRVKVWLEDVTRQLRLVFDRSNTYRALHTIYEELGAFGTAATIVEPDFDHVIHHFPLTIGEYAVATDRRGVVNTLAREFMIPVGAMVTEFGLENCSETVRYLWYNQNLDAEIPICHLIYPRAYYERDASKRDAKNMPYASVYFESARGGVRGYVRPDKVLRESGYRTFPALVPRWSAVGGDVYGSGPGMDALGDIKQLQHDQIRKAEAIDYQTKPPLQVPTAYKGQEQDFLPGGVSYVDVTGPSGGIRSAFDVRLDLNALLADIQDCRTRISKAFYADLFLMLASLDRRQITAREVAERHEEKLLMLGPVLERLHNELLAPKIDITFEQVLQAGLVPEPPVDLQGTDLKVEFVSMLAQAQRAVGLGAVDRLLGTVGAVAQLHPQVLDKINFDQTIDAYSDMLGVDPDLIVADENVAIIRQQRAQQAMAQQQMAAAPVVADTAKKLSEADTEGKNALTDALRAARGP